MEKISVVEDSKTDFQRFLEYARKKEVPQVLCSIVCEAALLEEGEGISLMPVTTVDLPLQKICGYQDVLNAAGLIGQDWELMCITMLEDPDGNMPSAIDTNKRLDVMLALIRQGRADKMVMFDRSQQFIKLGEYNYTNMMH